MKLLPSPRHLLSILLLSSLLWETFLAQTFEFSRGWTNGRKRATLVMTSPLEKSKEGGEKRVLLRGSNPDPEDLAALCRSYGLENYRMLKFNRLCRHWLSTQAMDSRLLQPRVNPESNGFEPGVNPESNRFQPGVNPESTRLDLFSPVNPLSPLNPIDVQNRSEDPNTIRYT
uniref:Pro-corazonin n=1 Tax=Cacopsylla melanoneura TaxID=428564 RepID=A0A8D9A9U9_9HEMI